MKIKGRKYKKVVKGQSLPYKRSWLIFGVPDGWEALGAMRGDDIIKSGRPYTRYTTHEFCSTTIHIGRTDGGVPFQFCPTCRIVL